LTKHFEAINKETLSLIERKVNETLISGLDVSTQIMDIQSAKNMGAMALFGEKYGNEVRVVKMGDASIELCGGTHVGNTAKIGLFKIISESGIAAGIRRIEAVTGLNFYDLFIFEENLFDEVSKSLKSNGKTDILPKVQQLHEETAKLKKELEEKNAFITEIKTSNLKPTEQNGFSLLFAELSNTAPDKLRDACDKFKNSDPNIVVILYTLGENKVNFAAACGAKAVEKGADAGKILKEISPIVGGGGGGRKDSAQSGGKNPEKIALAEKRFFELF